MKFLCCCGEEVADLKDEKEDFRRSAVPTGVAAHPHLIARAPKIDPIKGSINVAFVDDILLFSFFY